MKLEVSRTFEEKKEWERARKDGVWKAARVCDACCYSAVDGTKMWGAFSGEGCGGDQMKGSRATELSQED